MSELFSIIPVPAFVGLMIFALLLAVIASAPTAWVERAEKVVRKRQESKKL